MSTGTTKEIVVKFRVDGGAELKKTISLTDADLKELMTHVQGFDDTFSRAYESITQKAYQYSEATEDNVQELVKFITHEKLSEDAIYRTIDALKDKNRYLELGSEEYRRNIAATSNLRGALDQVRGGSLALTNTSRQTTAGVAQMNSAMGQLGYGIGDAAMFMVNFRMGMMAVANNIPFVIEQFRRVKDNVDTVGGSFKSALVGSLMGPGGVMLAINGLMLLLQILPGLLDETTEAIKDQSEEVDKLANSYSNLTLNQIENKQKEIQEEIRKFTEEMQSKYGGEWDYFENRGTAKELTEEEQKRYQTLVNQNDALEKASKEIGYIKNLENQINQLREQRSKIKDPASVKAMDTWIAQLEAELDKYDLGKGKKTVNQEFKSAEEKLKIVQNYEEQSLAISEASDMEKLQLKKMHQQQMIALYKKHNEDATALHYELLLTEQQIKKASGGDPETEFKQTESRMKMYMDYNIKRMEVEGATEEELYNMRRMNLNNLILLYKKYNQDYTALYLERDLLDREFTAAKSMTEEELAKLRAESAEDEIAKQRAVAAYEYQQNLEKYRNYENFAEIKAALDQKYASTKMKLDRQVAQAEMDAASQSFANMASLFNKQTALYKIMSISQIMIETYKAATAALSPPPIGVGPVFGPILAATTVAAGLANAASVASTKMPGYERGGIVVGEKGPEIIAPMQDYAKGHADLVNRTIIALERNYQPLLMGNSDNSGSLEKIFNKLDKWQKNLRFELRGKNLYAVVEKESTKKKLLEK